MSNNYVAMRINTVFMTNVQLDKDKDKEQLLGVTRKAFSGSKVREGRIVVFAVEMNQRFLSGKP
jgi:hypothetical protein